MEWDVLETYYQSGHITPKGYDYYLRALLHNYGLDSSEWREEKKHKNTNGQVVNQSELDLCKQKVQQLEKENMQLKLRLQLQKE